MAKLFEADDYIIINVLLLFLLINFNLQMGTIYGIMVLIDWMAYYIALDKGVFKFLPVEHDKRKRYQNLVWAMGAYVLFIFVTNFLLTRFSVGIGSFEQINSLIAETFSATPILYGSKYLKLLIWGLLIPIIETRFFFRTLLQWVLKLADTKLPTKVFSTSAVWIASVFGAGFSVFHIVAKGITNNTSLLVTFIFGFVSVMLVIHFKEAIQAMFLHVISNTIATMQQQGIKLFEAGSVSSQGLITIGGMLFATWLLLFHEIPFVGDNISIKKFVSGG